MKPHKKTPAKHQSHLMMEHIDISVTIMIQQASLWQYQITLKLNFHSCAFLSHNLVIQCMYKDSLNWFKKKFRFNNMHLCFFCFFRVFFLQYKLIHSTKMETLHNCRKSGCVPINNHISDILDKPNIKSVLETCCMIHVDVLWHCIIWSIHKALDKLN